jgi:hypothetical protein
MDHVDCFHMTTDRASHGCVAGYDEVSGAELHDYLISRLERDFPQNGHGLSIRLNRPPKVRFGVFSTNFLLACLACRPSPDSLLFVTGTR